MWLPRRSTIDRYLWPVVSNWLGYVELIVLCTMLFPLLLGVILPATVLGIISYLVLVVALCAFAAIVQDSRDRWMAFRASIRRDHARRSEQSWGRAESAFEDE